MNKLVELFCDADDFCKVFLPQWYAYLIKQGQIKRERACQMSMAEIMTVIILFHMSNQRDFKNFYKGYLARFHKKDFPTLLSYRVCFYSIFLALTVAPPAVGHG